MADQNLKKQFSEPEDIFSDTESGSGKRRVYYETVEPGKTSSVGEARSEGKVVWLMLGSVVIVLVTLGWYFYPKLKGFLPINVTNKIEEVSEEITSSTNEQVVNTENRVGVAEKDSDFDGLPDIQEEGLGLSSTDADTDNDNLSDKDEVVIYATDPRKADTDGDSFLDGDEVRGGFDPNGQGRLDDIFRIIPKENKS